MELLAKTIITPLKIILNSEYLPYNLNVAVKLMHTSSGSQTLKPYFLKDIAVNAYLK